MGGAQVNIDGGYIRDIRARPAIMESHRDESAAGCAISPAPLTPNRRARCRAPFSSDGTRSVRPIPRSVGDVLTSSRPRAKLRQRNYLFAQVVALVMHVRSLLGV